MMRKDIDKKRSKNTALTKNMRNFVESENRVYMLHGLAREVTMNIVLDSFSCKCRGFIEASAYTAVKTLCFSLLPVKSFY